MSKTTQQAAPSPETQAEALKIARATQKPGQTKEQTKLIAQGIQKGIELYKKQQKAKARERDKLRKKQVKSKQAQPEQPEQEVTTTIESQVTYKHHWLPWLLLVLSWGGFAAYLMR
ncbi:hypothetical protein BIT28_18410 [Photobacterium proteolyticum]|uniref:DUF2956 domain-containing protein n=1 Tax=Photobacterium proteolyticum TaxID=1903952 RepID=A0A1Q9GMW1_9GAMM|nr:DUF2956 domain-containing protein [Photobacterium proteolyticum]OLQ75993.1 hypothetical protein BIT28_18410 [Photobacterium proteolyticum]